MSERAGEAEELKGKTSGVRLIRRYTTRMLYDVEGSRSVTLDDIAQLIKAGHDIQVVDRRTKRDLTGITLAQVLLDGERRGQTVGVPVLAALIRSKCTRTMQLSGIISTSPGIGPGAQGSTLVAEDPQPQSLVEWISRSALSDMTQRARESVGAAAGGMNALIDLRRQLDRLASRLRAMERRLLEVEGDRAEARDFR